MKLPRNTSHIYFRISKNHSKYFPKSLAYLWPRQTIDQYSRWIILAVTKLVCIHWIWANHPENEFRIEPIPNSYLQNIVVWWWGNIPSVVAVNSGIHHEKEVDETTPRVNFVIVVITRDSDAIWRHGLSIHRICKSVLFSHRNRHFWPRCGSSSAKYMQITS